MFQVIEGAAVRDWGVLDCHAPTADETCPRCGQPTQSRLGVDDVYGECIEAEQCAACGWVAEFSDVGGEAA